MSKSLKRVTKALLDAGLDITPVELGEARTAAQAAEAAGCTIDQIAKSIIFQGETSGEAILFLTAGGNQVCTDKATALAGEPLGRADANLVRAQTGFAIGGVSPVGHLNPIRAFFDPRLSEFTEIWAAAGTPRHIFPIAPADLLRITGANSADFTK
ncbi:MULTISPECIES: YbaK/EbsC family protein [unclassified Marivivens]|jgi:prolyl-tRNA editing enzyme YbaK/EbsC (Cys-tRNA(Pro) deacylase)|uniref:YbaK/EbsC family protein n=1 Tax=unclassified Marivivens TaxID=2622455 RepID=UPI0008005E44|nr:MULTISPECIES: YbaK/EbsC family protein [unclassified Marivivens]MCL7405649.1 YbaK/EbsC family protein [Marivivens geojensis]OBR37700.1 aminoacyl-tRNA deacylase [Donghicola sp. JL3646]APO86513.1 aminoacyl-tRNA deacylase [Marivivens sp. JLT3646]NBQ50587.1 YbaK/EbsC family protein [Marivivens sp.]NBT52363.1 YbaK/EbsC family protein [Marivivens sp.]